MSHSTRTLESKAPHIIVVLGPPGSGKTFHCQTAAKQMHHVRHIDMDKILHEGEHEWGSIHAYDRCQKTPAGTFINSGVAVAFLEDHLKSSLGDTQETILLEGFPPNVEQARKYFEEAQRFGAKLGRLKAAISLTCSEAIAQDRRIKRGGPRDDPVNAHARCKAYAEETVPAIAYLRQGTGCKVVDVSADKSGTEGWLVFQDGLEVGDIFPLKTGLRGRSLLVGV
ncbi:MAG: hypothetical protein Q9184_002518 [Pyrenodesmia sp. 2 TL-2023]